MIYNIQFSSKLTIKELAKRINTGLLLDFSIENYIRFKIVGNFDSLSVRFDDKEVFTIEFDGEYIYLINNEVSGEVIFSALFHKFVNMINKRIVEN